MSAVSRRVEHGNMPEDFELLSGEQQTALLSWIKRHIVPAKKVHRRTSYGLKHIFENHGGFYVVNGAFKGAMLASGFKPINPSDLNWCFKIRILDPDAQKSLMSDRASLLKYAKKYIQSNKERFMQMVIECTITHGLKNEVVYVMASEGFHLDGLRSVVESDKIFKIGRSVHGGISRAKSLNSQWYGGVQWDCAHEIRCNDAGLLENFMHYLFDAERANYYRGPREIFSLNPDQERWILSINYIDARLLARRIADTYAC